MTTLRSCRKKIHRKDAKRPSASNLCVFAPLRFDLNDRPRDARLKESGGGISDLRENHRNGPAAAWRTHASTNTSNPPKNMRMASKGMVLASIPASRGSFIAASLTRSRCARDS